MTRRKLDCVADQIADAVPQARRARVEAHVAGDLAALTTRLRQLNITLVTVLLINDDFDRIRPCVPLALSRGFTQACVHGESAVTER